MLNQLKQFVALLIKIGRQFKAHPLIAEPHVEAKQLVPGEA
jgi:hypothetical protein